MAKFRYQHILSKVPEKRPDITGDGALKDGEIAVQIADEKLFVKNLDEDGLIEFSSDNKLDEKYYTKSQTSGATELADEFEKYYTKDETSGATELAEAFANVEIDVDQVIDETTSGSSGAVATKAVYNFVTDELDGINNEIDEKLGTGFTVSSVTDVIEDLEFIVSTSLNDLDARKLDATAYTPTDLSNYYTKNETSGATELSTEFAKYYTKNETSSKTEISDALALKADNSAMLLTFGGVEYDSNSKRINFYNDAELTSEVLGYVDATDFIKDGMVDTVEIKTIQSGDPSVDVEVLAITFNTDAGKEEIDIPLEDIFDSDNYYTKTEIDDFLGSGFTVSSVTEVINENERVTAEALNYINETIEEDERVTAEALNYINETIEEDERVTAEALNYLNTTVTDNERVTAEALNYLNTNKQNVLSAGTGIVIEGNVISSNAVVDVDPSLSPTSNNPVANSAITNAINSKANSNDVYTKSQTSGATELATAFANVQIHVDQVIDSGTSASTGAVSTSAVYGFVTTELQNNYYTKEEVDDGDEVISASLNDLNTRKLDASAYTPTDLSNYYTKDETSGSSEIATALSFFFDDAKYEMSGTTPVINFYNGNTIKSTIDASDFIVDGMIDDVELVASGDTTALVITWNTDGGSKVITLDVGDIFEADNYYTKSQTSGATELADAFANVQIHVDQVIDSGTSASTGAVATSAVFDFVTDVIDDIDDEIDERLGTAFTTSSVTEYIQDVELAISASLNDLDERIVDHSSNVGIHMLQVVSAITVNSNMLNVTCPDEITGSSNNGAQALIVYENSGDTDDYTITVSTSYKTPDGQQLTLTCPANGYCEVSYVNINGTIYVRGI